MTFSSSFQTTGNRRLGAKKRSFRPLNNSIVPPMPSPVVWLTVRDPNTLSIDGSNNLLTWQDKSGNGNNASTNNSTIRPTYQSVAGSNATINAIRFVGGGISVIDAPYVNTSSTMTVYCAFLMESYGTNVARIVSMAQDYTVDATSSATRAAAIASTTDQSNIRSRRNATSLSTSSGMPLGNWYVTASRFNGANHTLFVGGTSFSSVASTGAFNVSVVRIGNNTLADANEQLQGGIAEVAIYNASHSNQQVLDGLYSLALSLRFVS